MRIAILAIAGVEALAFAVLLGAAWLENSSEIRIAVPLVRLAAIPFLIGTLPALVLAIWNRYLPLAAALALGVVVLAVWAFPRL